MSATRAFSAEQSFFQQSYQAQEDHDNQMREAFDLLTLVNQSYQALDIGQLSDIDDLRRALEDVDSVKKSFMESNFPSDTESLGLASTITSSEELETFERMVFFFEKRRPAQGIFWDMFSIENGTLYLKSDEERQTAILEMKRKEAVEQLIKAIKNAESLGLTAFKSFESPIISKQGKDYFSKR
ncbi:hypothetical protein [Catalinimonas niigatensis]|uniref:hypothetical protein n=1 Tax=Catalinimonas niigatensis TaxID=1397264 RepID=UPI0026651A6D|nr:hypothetical protein [Catalinimonas niigatensis]WPP51029.1 hypothetical protein PZB72_01300 [Catalinimonas niigatensis]